MLDAKIRAAWDQTVRPVGRVLSKTGLTPDAITLFGMVIQAGAAYAIVEGRLLVGGLLAAGAGITDLLDGAVAKARGGTRRFGALLDSTTDRLTDGMLFAAIAWLYGVAPDAAERDQPWVAAVALIALISGFLVSYVKARAEGLGFECRIGLAERAERYIVIVLALLFDVVPVAVVVLAILSTVTFIQRMVHVRRQEIRGGG